MEPTLGTILGTHTILVGYFDISQKKFNSKCRSIGVPFVPPHLLQAALCVWGKLEVFAPITYLWPPALSDSSL